MRLSLRPSVTLIFVISIVVTASAEQVIVIGDSLSCGSFGKYLLQDLSKKGNQVTLYCAVSSTPQNWLKGTKPSGQSCQTMTTSSPKLRPCEGNGNVPKLASILALNKNAKVVIGLGTNSLLSPKADASYRAMAKAVQGNGNKCEWVGPPHLNPGQSKGFPSGRVASLERNLNSFYDSMGESIDGKCNLVDSRDLTSSGTPGNQTVDGVHRTDSAGKYWANGIVSAISDGQRQGTSHAGSLQ